MIHGVTRRSVLLLAASAVFAGCARDKPIILDRQAMAGVDHIGLPTVGVPNSPDVRVLNGVDQRLATVGLIGAIATLSASVVRGNRSDALVQMMQTQGFAPGPALTAMLAASLRAKGKSAVPVASDPKRHFMPAASIAPGYGALLDCYVSTYGFSALDDSDESPFLATITVPVRLVGRGGIVLMQDTVVISGGDSLPIVDSKISVAAAIEAAATATQPPPPRRFRSFSDVESDPAAAIEALRTVFEAAAAGIVQRVT